jgi:hypothetical protein
MRFERANYFICEPSHAVIIFFYTQIKAPFVEDFLAFTNTLKLDPKEI